LAGVSIEARAACCPTLFRALVTSRFAPDNAVSIVLAQTNKRKANGSYQNGNAQLSRLAGSWQLGQV
jgi:hypothetical protein